MGTLPLEPHVACVAADVVGGGLDRVHDALRNTFVLNGALTVIMATCVCYLRYIDLSFFRYNIDQVGFISMLPYIAQLVSSLGFGYVFNYLEQEWQWTTRQVLVRMVCVV